MNVRIIVLVAGAVVLVAAAYFFGMNKPAEAPEERGAILVPVVVPDLSAVAQAGKVKYDQFCASCHGEDAAGQEDVAPPFIHPVYEPNHHGDGAFLVAAKNGVRAHHWPFGDMPAVEGIQDADVTEIVAYVRELQRANGIGS